MDPTTQAHWTQLLLPGAVTVILIPLTIYFVRYYWDRRRWHAFEKLIRTWATETEFVWDELADGDWNALVTFMLSEAGFEPARIKDLSDLAVSFAKALSSLEVQGRIRLGRKGMDDGNPNRPNSPR